MASKARGLSQGKYATIAVPCLALLYTPLVSDYAPLVLSWLGFHLANFAGPMIAIVIACSFLVLPLFWAVVARLRHVGWTPWLALLLVVPGLLKTYFVWFPAPAQYPEWTQATLVFWVTNSLWQFSSVFALALIFVPGRKTPPEPAAAF